MEGLSRGSREGEALPFLGAQIASVMNSQGYLPCANSWYQPAILILKTKEDKVLYVNKRTSV
ncbi:MAG: hypothetical protein DWQ51_22230 [Microcystis wesenbergii TW10]|uniref:Uncharacterized protein n=1 Tax=Microcystis wesenbergii TW10 TaxID=2060474 RepID=A0A3E0LFY2_9CHRO|nr:MAG: hypothetical protein DWQ51_22230 [Microcystis wesenbergii TW10]